MEFFCCCETDTCHGGGVKLAEIQFGKHDRARKSSRKKKVMPPTPLMNPFNANK